MNAITINNDASSGTLWAVKAWHVERAKDRYTEQAVRDRSRRIAIACSDELSHRHGAGAVIAHLELGAAQ